MGFKINTVKRCPVVKGSRGVITMTPALVGQVAGAVRDKIEWIALLNGTRSKDGYEVTVDRFTIPQQYRTGGDAEMVELELESDVVGVMHSHHRMGAFFSGTDDKHLNPRFPCSIVVAIANNNLGFNYKAVGKVMLPCGAVGEEVEFKLQVAGIERFAAVPVRPTHEGEVASLGDCSEYSETEGEYVTVEHGNCGLSAVAETPLVFGMNDNGFLDVVQRQTLYRARSVVNIVGGFTPNNGNQKLLGDGGKGLAKGKKGKGGKYGAYKNGLKKLHRPGEEPSEDDTFTETTFGSSGRSGSYRMGGKCESCRDDTKLMKHNEDFDSWLCPDCWEEAEKIVANSMDLSNSPLDKVIDHPMIRVADDDDWLEDTELGAGYLNEGIARGLLGM